MKIPKHVEEKLEKGETILSSISLQKKRTAMDYYATNKRLLIFKKKSDCNVLEYDKISISLKNYGIGWKISKVCIIIFGVLVFIFGFYALSPSIELGSSHGTSYRISGGGLEMGILFWGLGILMVFIALDFRNKYYQMDYSGSIDKNLEQTRIERLLFTPGKADKFASVIMQKTDEHNKREN